MLGVDGGHVIGLLVPQSWTAAVGVSDHTYHVVAVTGGLLAGAMTVVGMAILIAFGLFALWPFTRLVHVFSAPSATSPAAAGTASADSWLLAGRRQS